MLESEIAWLQFDRAKGLDALMTAVGGNSYLKLNLVLRIGDTSCGVNDVHLELSDCV